MGLNFDSTAPLRWVAVSYSAGSSGPGLTLLTSSNSGAGRPTATVSTVGVTGFFTLRAAFFTGARLGLALIAVRFAAFATLRALPRLAELALRSLARPCTFDPFLRLAMIAPRSGWCFASH
jgi:hypothetical protein